MKLECINPDTGLFYRDLVVIDIHPLILVPTIFCQISHGIYITEMKNVVLTSRYRHIYKVHNFHMIWRD